MWNNNTIEDEIQRNSLEYGVAVNTDRSIPDAKSGLKPVAKRILYDAFIEKRFSNKPHVKSARIVGDVMGRFHPHGDSSIYGAMIRLSQNWVMRYPLIDVHGNNGTILGDGPAASRYTEARLSKIAEDGMLQNLNKNNVDFTLNYDETENEPITLPAVFPNLLCNPNEGIGWALGCSWAPHNLNEVAQAIYAYLNDEEPMLPGPDFPTGGIIINKNDIPNIMKTGHGSVKIRGKYTIEKNNIIFTEIPYGTRVETLMEEIGKVADENSVSGILDIRNETGKNTGIRLVIQVDKNVNINFVISQLFAKTNLQTTFSYNQVALIDKTPVELNLKDAIKVYVDHNINCIIREATFDKIKAEDRLEIVNGLLKALGDIDNIIALIKQSNNSSNAKDNLIKQYNFTENQAKAIISMRLGSLAHMEKIELSNEQAELIKKLEELNNLINNYNLQEEELKNRLRTIVEKFGDARRTEIINIEVPKGEDKEIVNVEPEKCAVLMTDSGLIKRIPLTSFKTQRRAGKGIKTNDDITNCIIRTNTIDNLMIFSDKGKMYRMLVDNIPVGNNTSKGQYIKSLIEMDPDENPVIMYSIYRDTEAKYVMFITKNGLAKKTSLEEYLKMRKRTGVAAISLNDGDSIASVFLVKNENIIILTKNGNGIQIKSTDIPAAGRTTKGIKGITLKDGDEVLTALPIHNTNDNLALFHKNGTGFKISLKDLPLQNRAGKGLSCSKEEIVAAALVENSDRVLIVGTKSSICIEASEIPILSRGAGGNQLLKGIIEKVSKI